jgi:hypothetical protein
LAAALRGKFTDRITVELVAGSRGVFDVHVGEERVFCKHEVHRFPDDGEVEASIAARLDA